MQSSVVFPKRTHTCGALQREHAGTSVVLNGWVDTIRDHGGLRFIDLRDRYGRTQVVVDPAAHVGPIDELRAEYVIAVTGKVRERPEGMRNPKLATGEIEVAAERVDILNRAAVPPFEISEADAEPGEDVRLRYRYLDLRRAGMQRNLIFRARVTHAMREFLSREGFLDLETPLLTKSTPEGARDFLVPSRIHQGRFFALPQSPQLFKQLFMIAGFDRYYQICRCLRDEDLRADRQPEFTQLDMEMAFVDENDVIDVTSRLVAELVRKLLGREVTLPIPRLEYDEAMARYGSDRPDLRFELEIRDVSSLAATLDFHVFRAVLEAGGAVRGLRVPAAAGTVSRKDIEACEAVVKTYGAKGLAWTKLESDGPKGPLGRFLEGEKLDRFRAAFGAQTGDIVFCVADRRKVAATALGELRLHLGRKLGLIDASVLHLVWVVDFPLLEWSEDERRWNACHHPFTSPRAEDLALLQSDPGRVRARAYDIVLNGIELGGGSVRIHTPEVQSAVFDVLQLTRDEARAKFGFLLDALSYGAPPHAGIALGLDRFVMLLLGLDSIRDVIAYPKTARGNCLMTGAPSPVDGAQLRELGLATLPPAGG
jgi:aspartyl-tRNA synthetase